MLLKVRRKFSAAHRLPRYDGDCKNLHGHTWVVEFLIDGPVKESGMVEDFKVLKNLLDAALPDHKFLNDLLENPTAENLAQFLFDKISNLISARGLKLKRLELWENENASAIISAD